MRANFPLWDFFLISRSRFKNDSLDGLKKMPSREKIKFFQEDG